MHIRVNPSGLSGECHIPASKSHTIRALFLSLLAQGESVIRRPLATGDCLSCKSVCQVLGSQIQDFVDTDGAPSWRVTSKGIDNLSAPSDVLDVGNSGTALYLGLGVASLIDGYSVFTGDYQIRRRPAKPLLDTLNTLGATAFSTRDNGCAPIVVRGVIKGGKVTVNGFLSPYVSSPLLCTPLASEDTEITVVNVNEQPYLEMTLQWIKRAGANVTTEDYTFYRIKGNQRYKPFRADIAADFESMCFPLVGAVMTESDILMRGLDLDDVQGDKVILDVLMEMGADIEIIDRGHGGIRVKGGRPMRGTVIDCANIPDAIPILSVLGAYAQGKTVLTNIASSRKKETDRPSVMQRELAKMGIRVDVSENEMTIYQGTLTGAHVEGHNDHRVVMSMAVAGLAAKGVTTVSDAEDTAVSFPDYVDFMRGIKADMTLTPEA